MHLHVATHANTRAGKEQTILSKGQIKAASQQQFAAPWHVRAVQACCSKRSATQASRHNQSASDTGKSARMAGYVSDDHEKRDVCGWRRRLGVADIGC